MKFRLYTPLLLAALCLQSCAYRASINDLGQITVRPPNRLMRCHGIRAFEKIKQHNKISTDPRYTAPVERVAKRLKKVIDMPGAEWEFIVFKDNSPNAFALPGGKVGINTGLFRITDSDALLAAALGHEISHVTANHAEKRMYQGLGLALLGTLLWHSLDHNEVEDPGYSMVAFGIASYLLTSLPFSRNQEYESDRIGAVYMAKAGYHPRQSIELWRRLKYHHNRRSEEHKPELLRTHPLDGSRIQALKNFIPVAMESYNKDQK